MYFLLSFFPYRLSLDGNSHGNFGDSPRLYSLIQKAHLVCLMFDSQNIEPICCIVATAKQKEENNMYSSLEIGVVQLFLRIRARQG
jgi:hypothetical protein